MLTLSPSKIKKQNFDALSDKMSIGFIDESTFVISQNVGRILVGKGEKARRQGFEKRHDGISVTGLYTTKGEFFYKSSKTKKQIDFLEFLYKIRHKIKKKRIVLIIDNARIHHSKKVVKYCDEHNIKLVFLPPYSPELNKIEFIRKQIKNNFRRIQWKYNDIKKAIKISSNEIKSELKGVDILEYLNTLNS